MRSLVIIPTYQERDNVEQVLRRTREAAPDAHVLVVDDGSPDGTADLVEQLGRCDDHVHVLRRTAKQGLGAAYRAGFAWATQAGYEAVVEMDADLSHPPERLPELLAGLASADLVIGSRYVAGGATEGWPWHRQAISRTGNAYVRLALRLDVRDATAGFRAFRTATLDAIGVSVLRSNGYCFQVETAYRTRAAGLRAAEVPICFVDRVQGTSKMSSRIVAEALLRVTWWAAKDLVGLGARRAVARTVAAAPRSTAPGTTAPGTTAPGSTAAQRRVRTGAGPAPARRPDGTVEAPVPRRVRAAGRRVPTALLLAVVAVGLVLGGCAADRQPSAAGAGPSDAPDETVPSQASDAVRSPLPEPASPSASQPPAPSGPVVTSGPGTDSGIPDAQAAGDVAVAAAPVSLDIPAIGVSAPVGALGVDTTGAVQVPGDGDDVGWLGDSAAPGGRGPAVLLGHVDSGEGPGVFHDLEQLAPGDLVQVRTTAGQTVEYTVTGTGRYPKDDFPTDLVYGPAPGPLLRLVTCGGVFDETVGHHLDNVVVFAVAA